MTAEPIATPLLFYQSTSLPIPCFFSSVLFSDGLPPSEGSFGRDVYYTEKIWLRVTVKPVGLLPPLTIFAATYESDDSPTGKEHKEEKIAMVAVVVGSIPTGLS